MNLAKRAAFDAQHGLCRLCDTAMHDPDRCDKRAEAWRTGEHPWWVAVDGTRVLAHGRCADSLTSLRMHHGNDPLFWNVP